MKKISIDNFIQEVNGKAGVMHLFLCKGHFFVKLYFIEAVIFEKCLMVGNDDNNLTIACDQIISISRYDGGDSGDSTEYEIRTANKGIILFEMA